MLDAQQQQEIRTAVLNICGTIRGFADVGVLRDHLLALLLLKYLSDLTYSLASQRDQGCNNALRGIAKYMDFYSLLSTSHKADIGKQIDQTLAALEAENPSLQGAFRGIRFDSTSLGSPEQRKRVLSQLLASFDTAALDFRSADKQAADAVAFTCDSLISHMAVSSGKHGGDFFTPPEISRLIARLMRPEPSESVYDPCCGSGTLLLICGRFAADSSSHSGHNLYGQEKNGNALALAKINMVLHGATDVQLTWGDTLRDPKLIANGRLQTFDVVVSNPPFNLKDWGHELAENDPYHRYSRGIPPRAAGDYAFISHMVETLTPDRGRMAVVVALGVLFRSGAEQLIRERLLEENLVDAVIVLPAKLFAYTVIPVALLVLRKKKSDNRVLFIDASRSYQHGKLQNTLREEDLTRIERTYLTRQDVDRYARVVCLDEIMSNDANLSVARYIDTTEELETIDLTELRAERMKLKSELESLELKLAVLLREAGI